MFLVFLKAFGFGHPPLRIPRLLLVQWCLPPCAITFLYSTNFSQVSFNSQTIFARSSLIAATLGKSICSKILTWSRNLNVVGLRTPCTSSWHSSSSQSSHLMWCSIFSILSCLLATVSSPWFNLSPRTFF